MGKVARHVKDLEGYTGVAVLCHLTPPIVAVGVDGKEVEHCHVVVSATTFFCAPETYIFPASGSGEVVDWGELAGSYRGGLDIGQALRNAGYEYRRAPVAQEVSE